MKGKTTSKRAERGSQRQAGLKNGSYTALPQRPKVMKEMKSSDTYEKDVITPLRDAVGRARKVVGSSVGQAVDKRAVYVENEVSNWRTTHFS